MSRQLKQRELRIDLASGEYHIIPIDKRVHGIHIVGPVDYGWAQYLDFLKKTGASDPGILTWGGGPLAGSRIPGTRRLVFCGYSPQWQGFYTSSVGGAAYVMHRVGVDFVSIIGEAPHDSVLILNHYNGEIHVRLEAINPDLIWTGYVDPDGERLFGFYALQQAVFDRYSREYEQDWVRIFAVGPASRTTNQGIIGSNQIKKGRVTSIDDWAGRGGLGSRMLQRHRIAACIFGGNWEDPDLKNSSEINGYFERFWGESMIKVDLGATEKYRYVPDFNTGGTFGVNMHTADEKLFSFNYSSIYYTDEARLAQHKKFIQGHYLQQFNEEIILPKKFTHCGEPCSVACKKYDRVYKKDYEPYQALGPQCGIFDQRAAEDLVHFVDAMGIDAIQIGGTVAWLMELISSGMLDPEDFNLPPAEQLNFKFAFDNQEFDVVRDSVQNAHYAKKLVELIVFAEEGKPFRAGIRSAAQYLDEQFVKLDVGSRFVDRAVYLSHSHHGCMTPNQYWVPGMFSPMAMMGKYFVYYGVDYLPPRVLGKRCVERWVYELFSENSGVCRFHRKWVETIIDEIISAHYDFPIDYKAHQFELAKGIFQHEDGQVVFWESQRLIDIIWKYLEKWHNTGLQSEDLLYWVESFRKDRWLAAREYWTEVREGITEAFSNGPLEIPNVVAPYQAAHLDVMERISARQSEGKKNEA